MKKFMIVSDSCCDLDANLRKQYDVEYIPMHISYDDVTLPVSLDWEKLSSKEFYDILRSGKRVFTSQAVLQDYMARFEAYLKDGYDILSISCSSALSASVNASMVARDELQKKYPDAKIICIDSLTCSFGEGLLCMLASRLRAEGKAIEEVAETIEKLKICVHQVGTVDELKYLKRAGRISAGKALFGALLNVKPIILSNAKGENVSGEKTKGRANSMRRVAELTAERYTGEQVSEIFISHGDCLEEAEALKAMLLEKIPTAQVTIGVLNAIMGASCGPKTLGVYFVGVARKDEEFA